MAPSRGRSDYQHLLPLHQRHLTAVLCGVQQAGPVSIGCAGVYIVEVPFSEKFQTETKPIPMKWQLQKPNFKPISILPKIPIFSKILTRASSKYRLNTKKIPKNLGQKCQIPIWYWYFLGIPNFWFPIDITWVILGFAWLLHTWATEECEANASKMRDIRRVVEASI